MQWILYYWALLALISLTFTVKAIEPNFEDIEESKSESQRENLTLQFFLCHISSIMINALQ